MFLPAKEQKRAWMRIAQSLCSFTIGAGY